MDTTRTEEIKSYNDRETRGTEVQGEKRWGFRYKKTQKEQQKPKENKRNVNNVKRQLLEVDKGTRNQRATISLWSRSGDKGTESTFFVGIVSYETNVGKTK